MAQILSPAFACETRQAAEGAITWEIAQACRAAWSGELRALILTGSLARGEGSFLRTGAGWKLLGDVDLLAVMHEGTSISNDAVGAVERSSEKSLASAKIEAHVSIGVVSPRFLRRLEPHIFSYELRECGRVLAGDSEILSLVPSFAAMEIQLADAFRLLCNRIVEQLDWLAALQGAPGALSPDHQYGLVKLYLDLATSLLVFVGEYAPTYARRLDSLCRLCERRDLKSTFDLRRFCQRVALCTEIKLHPRLPEFTVADWSEAVAFAQSLWAWQLAILRPRQRGFSKFVRGRDGIGCESFQQWLRGWLCVLRHQGWLRSWRNWGKWFRLASISSPRYLVYSLATQLLFAAPVLATGQDQFDTIAARQQLLLPPAEVAQDPDWRHLAREIVRNYRELLVGTRS